MATSLLQVVRGASKVEGATVAKRTSPLVEIEGKQLTLTNLDKVLYPEVGFTKGQLIDYYVRIAPVLLPHLEGRPLTMKRYPNGVSGEFFYEKNCPKHRPEWVKTAPVWSDGNNRWMDYCLIEDVATLVWAANLADIELHTSLSMGEKIEQPTYIVFDLDPGPPATIVKACQVGFWVKAIFEKLGMESFAKTSGSKGLQIYVPLNTAVDYDHTKGFAKTIARMLETAYPADVVSDMKKALRTDKILVDWSQNDRHKTTVNVYSVRAKEKPTVSTPVTWKEVQQCLKKQDPDVLVFTTDDVLKRVEKSGDLWEPLLTKKQKLPPTEKLEGLGQTAPPGVVKEGKAAPAKKAKKKRATKVA
jgi:bifunctional non-homologous end joining protein LigD